MIIAALRRQEETQGLRGRAAAVAHWGTPHQIRTGLELCNAASTNYAAPRLCQTQELNRAWMREKRDDIDEGSSLQIYTLARAREDA